MQRLSSPIQLIKPIITLSSKPHFKITQFSTSSSSNNNDNNKEWNDAWETAWLPAEDLKTPPAPWDSDVNFGLIPDPDPDPDTKAFINDMNDNWVTRQGRSNNNNNNNKKNDDNGKGDDGGDGVGLYRLENVKRDYRVNKQRVHASLWLNEIEILKRSDLGGGCADDIDKLLDSCSEIFDSPSNDFNDPKVSSTSELKNKPDGWETTAKSEDGNVWEMSQREEDILLQEFERRMAFCKFQIASFIKTHIFSRRRPIDGWKYMIEVIGPNARKGKGSVSRLPGLADPATQPFTEERTPASRGRSTSRRSR